MSKDTSQLNPNIHHALNLDGDVQSIKQYYDQWASTYNADVFKNYYGVQFIVDLMQTHAVGTVLNRTAEPADVRVADVGCGTGLLGAPLNALGYKQLDGLDLSLEMLDKAKATGHYRQLHSSVNINEPIAEPFRQQYDITVCLGVFTPGHVKANALHQLIQMTRNEGLVVISTRVPYYDATDFQWQSDQAIEDHSAVLLECAKHAPYRDDGDAHYWVYQAK